MSLIRKIALLLRRTAEAWVEDDVPRLAASLAFYAMFSLSPLLILVLTGCGAIFGEEAVRGQLDNYLQNFMGARTAAVVQDMVKGATTSSASTFATVAGAVALLFGATGFFGEVKAALNIIWDAKPAEKRRALRHWVQTRVLSFGLIVVIMMLLMFSLVFSAGVSFASLYLQSRYTVAPALWGVAGFGAGLLIEVILFALVFRVLPDVRIPMRDVWWGAGLTAVLFEIGKWGLGWYLGRESLASSYGAAGSLLLVLLWVYYSSIIVLTGAVFTQVYSALRQGGKTSPAP